MPSDREPTVAPRRYITRSSRLQSESTSLELPSAIPAASSSRPLRSRVPEKRKALADATTNASTSSTSTSTRPSRAAKKPATAAGDAVRPSALSVPPRRRVVTRLATSSAGAAHTDPPASLSALPAAKKITNALKASKKVHFASGLEMNKENSAPEEEEEEEESEQVEQPLKSVLKKTVEVKPPPPSGLAARPKRVVRSKIKPPSGSEEAIAAVPALSPTKAKRFVRPRRADEDGSEDELLCPTSPGLSKKPQRLPAMAKNAMDGAELLGAKKPQGGSVLFASPARRLAPPVSPVKTVDRRDPSAAAAKQSLLMSPPKKTPGLVEMKKKQAEIRASSVKASAVAEEDAVDEDEDVSLDELSMPTTRKLVFTKKTPAAPEPVPAVAGEEEEAEDDDDMDLENDSENRPPPSLAPHPRGPPMGVFKPQFPTSSLIVHVDQDGDVTMDDVPAAPQPKKHLSPHEGGSSFGLFSIHSDSDDSSDESSDSGNASDESVEAAASNSENIAPSVPVQGLTTKLSDMGIERPKERSFGADVTGLAIDPALLETDNSNPFLPTPPPKTRPPPATTSRLPEAGFFPPPPPPSSRTTKIPLKPAHDTTPRSPSRTSRRISQANLPLTGASVFLDIHTSDGADGSSLFASILASLGARVLKSWNWNPDSETASEDPGLTHVVYKLGSPRTLSKLRAAKDGGWEVKCVGLGWVVECERREEWVEEEEYEVEIEMEERRRRRKSMEPKPVVVSTEEVATPKKKVVVEMERVVPRTVAAEKAGMGGGLLMSKAAEEAFQERLAIARSRSLKFAPKVGSPLAKRVWTMESH